MTPDPQAPRHVVHLPGGGVLHLLRCESCELGQCPGGPHGWAGPDDIEHAVATGRPCHCACASGPVLDPVDPFDDEPDPNPLTAGPCPLCGEPGACAWDADGRPLIHTNTEED